MLVLRSFTWQTTHKWTNRTSLPDNCPDKRLHITIYRLSSLNSNIPRIPAGNTTSEAIPTSPTDNNHQSPQHHHHHPQSVNAQFLNTVIQKLPFLMNEIRTKKNFSSILNNCSPFTNNNHHHHRHRCHQASKSNKVFLRYTPRDPRLRSNKHSSELSEDLCNYGELIGGSTCSSFKSEPSSKSRSLTTLSSSSDQPQQQSRYVEKVLVKDSSFIYGECKKKNCTQLFISSIY